MKGDWDAATIALLMVSAFAGGATVVGLTDFAVFRADWCPGEQGGRVECLRSWLGATSGWAAFVAATVTIFVLAGQMKQARRQSDWMVGEAMPSASMFDPRENALADVFTNRLQITNWNRDPILIQRIRIVDPLTLTLHEVAVVDHNAGRKNVLQREYERGRMLVPGWLERSEHPTFAEFDLTFASTDARLIRAAENGLARTAVAIAIDLTISGDIHHRVSLAVQRPDALVVTG